MRRGDPDRVFPAEGQVLNVTLSIARKNDREAARAMNAIGLRTSVTRGRNPLSKDTVRVILRNRFRLGKLPDGDRDQSPSRHASMVVAALFAQAHAQRARPQWANAQREAGALQEIGGSCRCGGSLNVLLPRRLT